MVKCHIPNTAMGLAFKKAIIKSLEKTKMKDNDTKNYIINATKFYVYGG